MHSILRDIIEHTRGVVAARRREVPIAALEGAPHFIEPRRAFEQALRGHGLAVIAETKKASPSKGVIRDSYDPAGNARAYEEAGAAAISVLTEPHFFRGAPEHLSRARNVTSLPLLRKDFVIDPYQMVEARALGADAVLLIAAALGRDQLAELHAAARELELATLLEVHHPHELDHVDVDAFSIIGVNNRDLDTFEVDLGQSARLFSQLPEGIVRVSESGLQSAADLAAVAAAGADAVLIGEAFMRAPEPGAALRVLLDAYHERAHNAHAA